VRDFLEVECLGLLILMALNSAKMTGFDLTTDWPKEKMMALLKVRDSLKVDC
jgi:hypothetical protein